MERIKIVPRDSKEAFAYEVAHDDRCMLCRSCRAEVVMMLNSEDGKIKYNMGLCRDCVLELGVICNGI